MNNWGKERTDETDSISPSTWQQYFKSLLINRSGSGKDLGDNTHNNDIENSTWKYNSFDPIIEGRITTAEMKEALNKLKNNKSPGPDAILAEYLKIFGETFENTLLKIIRILFSRHLYLPQWDTNYLKPIHKKVI